MSGQTVAGLDATDLFAGCGGLSLGATWAGVRVTLAINHWGPAVAAHQLNHPATRHVQTDLCVTSPQVFPRTELLLASPSCTGHSRSMNRPGRHRPGSPGAAREAERTRSRAHPWVVCEWAEHHRPGAVIVENVVELAGWPPFGAWLSAMGSLGYDHQVLSLNAAVFAHAGLGVAQSRDRLYVVFTRRGVQVSDLDPPVRAWCDVCGPGLARRVWRPGRHVGAHSAQYDYRCRCGQVARPVVPPAASVIDPSLPMRPVRGRRLAPATMERLARSLERWCDGTLHQGPWQPDRRVSGVEHLWISKQFGGDRGQSIHKPLGTITATDHHLLVAAPRDADPASVAVDDLAVRMLAPSELAAGMGLPGDYQLVGSQATRIRLIGNAVAPQVISHLVARVGAALDASTGRLRQPTAPAGTTMSDSRV